MAKKKQKNGSTRSKKNRNMLGLIGIGALVVLGIITIIIVLTMKTPTAAAAATVNGVVITQEAVDTQHARLNPVQQLSVTKEDLLEQMIDEELLSQSAKSAGVVVTSSDVTNSLKAIQEQNGFTDEQLDNELTARNTTRAEFSRIIERQLLITRYLNQTILMNIEPTDDELMTYYTENLALYGTEAQVTARHVLALAQNRTSEEAKAIVEETLARFEAGEEFCDLVEEISEDPGSIAACGEYTFGPGYMVPEFENASFGLAPNETALVETQFGWHLILKIADVPARITPFEDVKEDVKEAITLEQAQTKYDELISSLRNAARINYGGTTENTNPEASLAACLGQSGAKFYGAYWCSHCNNQKAMFGDNAKDLPYIECATPDDPRGQTQPCKDAGITGYPTWVFADGTRVSGEQSFEKLAELSGCTI